MGAKWVRQVWSQAGSRALAMSSAKDVNGEDDEEDEDYVSDKSCIVDSEEE